MACFIAEAIPIHTGIKWSSQMTAMRSRFKTYTHYSMRVLMKPLSPEETADAYTVNAYLFSSMYMENKGNSQFTLKKLPIQAQFSTINIFRLWITIAITTWTFWRWKQLLFLEVITGRSGCRKPADPVRWPVKKFVSVPITGDRIPRRSRCQKYKDVKIK